jgi:small-conductance mechanosensitive channel
VVAYLAKKVVTAMLRRHGGEGFASDLVGRLVALVIGLVGLVYSMSVLGVRVGPLLGALGIVGVAVAFAFKDILENFIAGVLLQIRRPFDRGDQIITGDYEGTVYGVNMRSVIIDDPDGQRIIIPSSRLITEPIVNLTAHPLRRTALEVGVSYGANLDEAVQLVRTATQQAPGVSDQPAADVVVSGFGDSSVGLVVTFWHGATIADQWQVRDRVARAVKRALDGAGIDIPFPQLVVTSADQRASVAGSRLGDGR